MNHIPANYEHLVRYYGAMRILALMDDADVIERVLRHLKV